MGNAARISILSILFPLVAFGASFDRDLYFGISSDPDVTRLQEFLSKQGVYSGPVTGNFFKLTQEGVKRFQEREGIKPAFGYFGPKTRARANASFETTTVASESAPAQSREALIAFLAARIKELEAQIKDLREKPEAAVAPLQAASPQIEPTETVPVAPEPVATSTPVVISWIDITGSSTLAFPDAATTPLRVGTFEVFNGTREDAGFIKVDVDIIDNMDSSVNRGRKVYLLIREGTTPYETLVSTTPFTFHSKDPTILSEPHTARIGISNSVIVKAGERKTFSLWVELFELVSKGSLEFKLVKMYAGKDLDIRGGFDFLLTKTSQ